MDHHQSTFQTKDHEICKSRKNLGRGNNQASNVDMFMKHKSGRILRLICMAKVVLPFVSVDEILGCQDHLKSPLQFELTCEAAIS